MICEYCKREFNNLSYFNSHKKTAKYCLKTQNKLGINEQKLFTCIICSNTFSNKINLINHLEKKCILSFINANKLLEEKEGIIKEKEDIIKEKEDIITEKEGIIKEKDTIIEKLINDNNKYTEEIIELKSICKVLNSDHECIQEIAKQPKNITTNNNNKVLNVITPFNINDKAQIIDIVKNNYNINYIFSGQKGCARFVYENIIKDSEGNLKYICSDSSRFIYKYKDEYGNIQKDIDARRLTNLLIEGGLKNKACNMASEWWTDENGEVNTHKFEMLIEKAEAIRTMEQDNTEFKKELATMTSV